jgi:hypothetical protein
MNKQGKVKFQYIPFEKLVFLDDNPDTAANPRTRDEDSENATAESILKDPTFYENRPTLVNFTKGLFCVYAGDLRAHVAHHKLGWDLIPCNVEIDVPLEVQANRMILDNTHFAEWDTDKLAEWKFEPEKLEEMGVWIADDEDEQVDSEVDNKPRESKNNYSKKIQTPIYEPKNEKPDYLLLFQQEKTNELIADIQASNIPQQEKDFLTIAAYRHTVFNYERIADFYAHSSPEVQRLMEDSALVIIDFERAIELGYVQLSQEISNLYNEDYPDED